MTTAVLKYYKENPNAIVPSYGTEFAACFDLSACLRGVSSVKVFTPDNEEVAQAVASDADNVECSFALKPFHRALVPTGLIFDLPRYFSMRAHPRSGLSLKSGITLVNAEGVIDPDYVNPSYIPLINLSNVTFHVKHGDRLCQAELVEINNQVTAFLPQNLPPKAIGNRTGGFGSSGV